MSGTINLPLDLLMETLPTFENLLNKQPLEMVDEIAGLVLNSGDSNNVTEEFLAACKEVQAVFNEMTESARGAREDLVQTIDIAEYQAKRATVGDLEKRDASFQSSGIDASVVMKNLI